MPHLTPHGQKCCRRRLRGFVKALSSSAKSYFRRLADRKVKQMERTSVFEKAAGNPMGRANIGTQRSIRSTELFPRRDGWIFSNNSIAFVTGNSTERATRK